MSTIGHPDLPLGKDSDYPTTYTPSLLRSIDRAQLRATLGIVDRLPFQGEDTWNCYEFSWLNAKGRPEVGIVKVRVPCNSAAIVESKSLKLFLGSFRNHGAFHEDCTVAIAKRLIAELNPVWLRIGGYWYPRGGIPIDVFYQSGPPPEGLWLPDQGVAPYRGWG